MTDLSNTPAPAAVMKPYMIEDAAVAAAIKSEAEASEPKLRRATTAITLGIIAAFALGAWTFVQASMPPDSHVLANQFKSGNGWTMTSEEADSTQYYKKWTTGNTSEPTTTSVEASLQDSGFNTTSCSTISETRFICSGKGTRNSYIAVVVDSPVDASGSHVFLLAGSGS